jgi:hypothetical protein
LPPHAPEISFSASRVSSLRGVGVQPPGDRLVQARRLHQLEELAGVLGRADALDSHRVERVAEHQVVALVGDLADQSLAVRVVGERHAAPVENAHVEAALEFVREVPQACLQLLGEQLLRTFVLDYQDRHRLRHGERLVVDAGDEVQREVDEPGGLAVAAECAEQRQRPLPDDGPAVGRREDWFAVLSFSPDELVDRERKHAVVIGNCVGV